MNLTVFDGFIDNNRFIMRKMAGCEVQGTFKAEGLRSLARLIEPNQPFNYVIDKDNHIKVPGEMSKQVQLELNLIASELERG